MREVGHGGRVTALVLAPGKQGIELGQEQEE